MSPSPALVPASDAESDAESAAGLSLHVGEPAVSLGHRVTMLTMVNRGDRPVVVSGYPDVDVLDSRRESARVQIVHADSPLADDPGPRAITVAVGDCVMSALSWSNAVTSFDAADDGEYIQVQALPDEPRQTMPLHLDLGSPGQLTITAWARELFGVSGTGEPVRCSSSAQLPGVTGS